MKFANHIRMFAVMLASASVAHAGVTAVQKGAKLTIVGDTTNDVIHVEGAGALGEVSVSAGVTPVPIDDFIGVRDIEIKTGAGDDEVTVSGIEIGGRLKVRTGVGIDVFNLRTELSDGVTKRRAFIGGGIDASLGGQPGIGGGAADSIVWKVSSPDHPIVIGKNVEVRGAGRVDSRGQGASSGADPGDVVIGGSLSIKSEIQSFVVFFNTNVGGSTDIQLGNAFDTVELRRCHFVRAFTATLGGGDDAMIFTGIGEFNAAVILDGGKGTNTLAGFDDQIHVGAPVVKHFVP